MKGEKNNLLLFAHTGDDSGKSYRADNRQIQELSFYSQPAKCAADNFIIVADKLSYHILIFMSNKEKLSSV